jgi:long-chain acyl-CoA synthetase
VEISPVMDALQKARDKHSIPQQLPDSDVRTFADLFALARKNFSDLPAYTCHKKTITFGELDELSTRMAAAIQQRDYLEPGDRIAIQLPNLLQYPVAAMAILKAGMTLVNVNPLYTDRELENLLVDSGAKMVITFNCLAAELNQIVAKTDVREVVVTEFADLHDGPKRFLINFVIRYIKRTVPNLSWSSSISFRSLLNSGQAENFVACQSKPEDIAVLQYTGGTTGDAKGCMLTHANLMGNMHQVSQVYDHADWDAGKMRMMMPLPMYHIYAFDVSFCHSLSRGHESVLVPNPRDLDAFIKEMKAYPFDGFAGLNTLFNGLLNKPEFCEMDFSRLRLCLSGGMALTRSIADRWQSTTGVGICEGYGLTESSGILCVNIPGHTRLGTVGVAFPSTELRLVGDEGQTCGLDEPGELCFKGPNAMRGYWRKPEATAEVIDAEGWVHTGDIAVMDDLGSLSIVDRKKDMIIVSGFNVYPNEIEEVVIAHPDVIECAVVAGKGEHGEYVKLFVVSSRPDLTEEELCAYCREELTAYKVPREVIFRDELPKSNVGKILRKELRDES